MAYNAHTRAWVAAMAGPSGVIKGNTPAAELDAGPLAAFPWPVATRISSR